jgi:ribonuclease J
LSYALQEFKFPIISSEFTLGLARGRIEENGVLKNTKLIVVKDNERRQFGPFDCEFLPITHSVPHGFATAFHTPQGTILHTGDFKIDLTPVDGRLSDLSRIGGISSGDGIRLLLSDSTNAEEHGHSRSEKAVGGVLYDLMHQHVGRRIITACFASHIHRVQQLADAAQSFGRVIIPLGRSMRKNIAMARQMGILDIPDSALADIEDIGDYDDGQICVVSTGLAGRADVGVDAARWR